MVKVLIASPFCCITKDFPSEILLSKLCERIYSMTGIVPNDMRLTFEDQERNVLEVITYDPLTIDTVAPLLKNIRTSRILVEDTNANSIANHLRQEAAGNFEGATFSLSDEDYAQRKDTVLSWKMQNKLGRFDPQYRDTIEANRKEQQEKLRKLEVNQRCSVKTKNQPERRGWLRFTGKVPEISQTEVWCGVEFDEPVGKGDGSFKGTVYFGPVKQNFGGFIKPTNVETGPQFEPFEINDLDLSEDEV